MDLLESVVINWNLLCLVLGTVLLTKLLRLWSPKLCNKLAYWYTSEPPDLVSLKREVSDIKQQLQHVNMMDNFADHARLQRRINQKDRELQVKEKGHKSRLTKLSAVLSGGSSVLIFIMRIGVVMLNRRRPVAIFPTELFHPVSPLLAFPTGQPGGIGCPLWAVACSQFIDTVMQCLNVV
ncbi:guided entry of tail-anchored proteins factor 1-like [Halichondria panicea]|uniref:guided entry of tail-anchored proteins factor 1-like n=1 Tax=Halichondria panicea TaxID=6063 RepID=UPI00312B4E9D